MKNVSADVAVPYCWSSGNGDLVRVSARCAALHALPLSCFVHDESMRNDGNVSALNKSVNLSLTYNVKQFV